MRPGFRVSMLGVRLLSPLLVAGCWHAIGSAPSRVDLEERVFEAVIRGERQRWAKGILEVASRPPADDPGNTANALPDDVNRARNRFLAREKIPITLEASRGPCPHRMMPNADTSSCPAESITRVGVGISRPGVPALVGRYRDSIPTGPLGDYRTVRVAEASLDSTGGTISVYDFIVRRTRTEWHVWFRIPVDSDL